MSGVVIVGAGQAGFQLAASLRELGYAEPVTLVGDETVPPYQRPPLSKSYLAGKTKADGLWLRQPAFLDEHRIVHRAGVRATSLDREGRRLRLADGSSLPYAHLVLATGSRNRALPCPGADSAGVHQLRSLEEADRLHCALAEAEAVVVIGAGFIGLEFAAICASLGRAVTVLEAAHRPMARAVSGETSAWFLAAHEAAGVTIRCGAAVAAIEAAEGRATAVRLTSGERFAADLILVGIGVVANDELAREAGLATGDGIAVDAFLRAADSAVSAIGDCARFPTRFAAGLTPDDHVRIESVQNAIDQARCVAARLTGRPHAYDAVPWFWSDQGRHKLQIAGLASPADASVVRGDPEAFSVFRFRSGRLSAVESVNRPGDHMAARRLLAAAVPLKPEQVGDPSFDLRALAKAGA